LNTSSSPRTAASHSPATGAAKGEDSLPHDPRLHSALDALRRQDYPQALRLCESARKQGVAQAEVLPIEAEVFKATEYLDREIETLRRWIDTDPRNHRPWLKLFHIYLDLGWKAEAAEASEYALRLAPRDPRVHIARALFFYRSNEPTVGLQHIDRARQLDPSMPALINLHTTILLKALRFAEAEALIRKSLDKPPHPIASLLLLAQALLGQDKTQEAVALFQEVQQREPQNVEAAYQLGVIAHRQNNLAEAARQLETAARIDSQYSNVLWHLGRIYREQGREEEGSKLMRVFKKMDENTLAFETALARLQSRPNNPEVHYRLAQFRLSADELPQAIVELRRTLQLRPGHLKARRDLIEALRRHGRVTESRKLAQQLLNDR
jgi:cytochrome c-type biogenesis protein CcmH/NrfG